ncbi:MAG: polyphenol oxidase family protein [Sandaracinaceae bacterium]|nr:polyphenol oxidase family protein [Sandaracinaceae bacterium]
MSAAPYEAMNLARNVGDDPVAVAENHTRFAALVGYDLPRLAESSQVHGVCCLDVDALVEAGVLDVSRCRAEQADALRTSVRGVAVGVRTADCVPLLVGDVRRGQVAAIHAGWRGAVEGVVVRTLGALLASGSEAADLVVAIGPHIRVASFEVGADVARAIDEAVPRERRDDAERLAGPAVIAPTGGRPHACLLTLVLAQLLAAGVEEARIDDVGGDTCAERARFHSHRRDGAQSGRQLSVIVARGPTSRRDGVDA